MWGKSRNIIWTKWKYQQRDRWLKGKPKRNSGAGKYNYWNENLLRDSKSDLSRQKKKNHRLEEPTMKIIESEEQEEKRLKKMEQSLRDPWGTIKLTNICNCESPKRRRERKEQREYLKKQGFVTPYFIFCIFLFFHTIYIYNFFSIHIFRD